MTSLLDLLQNLAIGLLLAITYIQGRQFRLLNESFTAMGRIIIKHIEDEAEFIKKTTELNDSLVELTSRGKQKAKAPTN